MTANEILKASLAPFRSVLILIVPLFDFLLRIMSLIPLWSTAYQGIMTMVWLPFSGYMKATGWVYRKLFFLRPVIALIAIPVLIPLDFLMALLSGPEEDVRGRRALAIASWPGEPSSACSPGTTPGRMPTRPYLGPAALAAIRRCPHCHNIIPGGREICVYCGRNPRDLSETPIPLSWGSLPLNRKAILHCLEPGVCSAGEIKSCPLCGDMVRSNWEKCPRCGEVLEGIWSLPPLTREREAQISKATPQGDPEAA